MIDAIIRQTGLILPLVLGGYISLSLLKLPDLSLESAYLFGAVLATTAPSIGCVPLIMAIIGGATVGLISGSIHQYGKIPFLLTAILTNGLFHGASQYILQTGMKSVTFCPFSQILEPYNELFLICFVGALLLTISFFLLRSQFGYSLAIYGNNPNFFPQHGLSTRYVVITGLMIAGSFGGISGYLFSISNGFVDITIGYGVVLLTITALVFGKKVTNKEKPSILCPLIGVFIYLFLQEIILAIGIPMKYFLAIQACTVLTLVLVVQKKQFVTHEHLGV